LARIIDVGREPCKLTSYISEKMEKTVRSTASHATGPELSMPMNSHVSGLLAGWIKELRMWGIQPMTSAPDLKVATNLDYT
jgi:hypothetical protein